MRSPVPSCIASGSDLAGYYTVDADLRTRHMYRTPWDRLAESLTWRTVPGDTMARTHSHMPLSGPGIRELQAETHQNLHAWL
jgi:hypothetical protein